MQNQNDQSASRRRWNLGRFGIAAAATALLVACGSDAALSDPSSDLESTETDAALVDIADEAAAADNGEPEMSTEETSAEVAVEPPSEPLGSGTVVFDGIDYVYETTFCANDEDGLFNYGVGVTAEGVPFVAEVSVIEALDQEVFSIDLNFGQEGIYSAPSLEHPLYAGVAGLFGEGEFAVDGDHITGWVLASDIRGDEDPTVRLEADVLCASSNAPEPIDVDEDAVAGTNYCEIAQQEVDLSASYSDSMAVEPGKFEEYLAQELGLLAQIDRPAGVADDLALIEAAMIDLDTRAAATDYVFLASIYDVAETIGAEEVIQAGLRIQAFNEAACGIEGPNQ